MTAVTPAEQAEITRFGMFDEEILSSIHEHADDNFRCGAPRGCDRPAIARFTLMCPCRLMRLTCAHHMVRTMAWFDENRVRHRACGHGPLEYKVTPL